MSLFIAMLIAPMFGNLGQVFQAIQEYTGVVSPGILAVFIMGLFYKKATNNAAIWGILLSIPVAMYFKIVPKGWIELIPTFAQGLFIGEIPFLEQATISLWDSIDNVKEFAYKNEVHRSIIRKTKSESWYSEELFCRFYINKDYYLKR